MLLFYVVLLILNIISVLCETFTHLTNVDFALASHRTRNFNQLPHMVDDTIGDGSVQSKLNCLTKQLICVIAGANTASVAGLAVVFAAFIVEFLDITVVV